MCDILDFDRNANSRYFVMQSTCMCSVVCISHEMKVQEHLFNRLDSNRYCCIAVVSTLTVPKYEIIKYLLTRYTLKRQLLSCAIMYKDITSTVLDFHIYESLGFELLFLDFMYSSCQSVGVMIRKGVKSLGSRQRKRVRTMIL